MLIAALFGMAQIFGSWSNAIARSSLLVVPMMIGGAGWLLHAVYWSPYTTNVTVPREQPVPFSHKHHVDGLGIDCRFCHTTVEKSAFAGMPDTETCMTCHSQLWTDAPLLSPVRQSLARNEPLRWARVHDLPDFVFFNHSIHVNKGVSCSTCHGEVGQMPLTRQANTLYMKWCLNCHRNPERFVGRPEEVFVPNAPKTAALPVGEALVHHYGIQRVQLTDCSICHR